MIRRQDFQSFLVGGLFASGVTLILVGLVYGSDVTLAMRSIIAPPVFNIPSEVNRDYVIDIIDRTNIERKKAGRNTLKENSALSYAAYLRARDILQFQDFSHEATKSGNKDVNFAVRVVGYRYSSIGENLALGGDDPNGIVAGWINSPGHRDNLLSKDFDETGVAVLYGTFQDDDDVYVIVQLFGKLI